MLRLRLIIMAFDPPYWSTANIKNLEKRNIFTGFMFQKIIADIWYAYLLVFFTIFKVSRKFWIFGLGLLF